jgi:hypothetical protein
MIRIEKQMVGGAEVLTLRGPALTPAERMPGGTPRLGSISFTPEYQTTLRVT